MHTTIYQADLSDWNDILELHEHFKTTKAVEYIAAELPDLQMYMANSLVMPATVGFLCVRHDEKLVGMASVCIVRNPVPSTAGVQIVPQTFIHAAYVRNGVPGTVSKELDKAIQIWGQQRGATWVFANMRTDKRNVGFERKFGFKKLHLVMGKEIDNG